MKTTICIDDILVYTRIGCRDRERKQKLPLTISLRLEIDASMPWFSDNIDDALDYGYVIRDISKYCQLVDHDLLEHFGYALVEHCEKYCGVSSLRLKIQKNYLRTNIDAVSLEFSHTYQKD